MNAASEQTSKNQTLYPQNGLLQTESELYQYRFLSLTNVKYPLLTFYASLQNAELIRKEEAFYLRFLTQE